nr:oligosaccharide flippase family protein [Pseudopedobacter sp.]
MNIFISLIKNITKTKVFANFVNLSTIQVSNILLMMLMIPVITRAVGLEMFGQVMVANAFAALVSILVTYATTQTSVKDIAVAAKNSGILSKIFTETLFIRIIFFTLVIIGMLLAKPIFSGDYLLYVTAIPLIFAEVVNPLFFYLGQEDLKLFNLSNLLTKIVIIFVILIFIDSKSDAVWVNFIIGGANSISYLLMLLLICKKYQLSIIRPKIKDCKLIIKDNFYLVANNFSVYLQQSIMLFALQIGGSDTLLGAYSICDKIVWSCRILIISIFNAIYPKASKLFSESSLKWQHFKKNVKLGTAVLFFVGSLILFIFPDLIIYVLTGKTNDEASLFLREMAFVPFIAALNFMNVLDRLLHNDNYTIFKIALIILLLSAILSSLFIFFKEFEFVGFYILIIETFSLLLYEFFIRRSKSYA